MPISLLFVRPPSSGRRVRAATGGCRVETFRPAAQVAPAHGPVLDSCDVFLDAETSLPRSWFFQLLYSRCANRDTVRIRGAMI